MIQLLGNTIMQRGDGKQIALVGDRYTFLLTGKETNGEFALLDFFVPPGGGPPPHLHTREDEVFYVLEGELTVNVNGTPVVLKAGETAHAVKNVRHFFRNESSAPVRFLCLVVPAGLEEFFAEVGDPLNPDGSIPAPGPDQIGRIIEAAPRYGVQIFPPGS